MSADNGEQNATNLDRFPGGAVDAKIASLLIESPSMTDQEIASQVGISRQAVNRRKNAPAVQDLVRSVLAIPEREIRRLTAKALLRLEEMLDHEDPRIKLAATMALVKLSEGLMSDSFKEACLKGSGTI
jgi:hypothetical protein